MSISERMCVSIGPMEHHRLAALLFDRVAYISMDFTHAKQSDELADFVEGLKGRKESCHDSESESIELVQEVAGRYSVKWSGGTLDCFAPAFMFNDNLNEDGGAHPFIAFADIPSISPENLTNELVFEFVGDKDSISKLRRLRAFSYQNYEGKPLSFVRDDIETRILDYKTAARKWGLATVDSSLSIAATEKLLSGAYAGIISAALGMPLMQAAAVGATTTLATTTLKVGLSRKNLALSQSQDVVAYLMDLEKATQT